MIEDILAKAKVGEDFAALVKQFSCRCTIRSLTRYFEVVTRSPLTQGIIAGIQTFGTGSIFGREALAMCRLTSPNDDDILPVCLAG